MENRDARTYTHVRTPLCVVPARLSRRAVGGAWARTPPPAVGRAPPSPQRTPPAAPARVAPALSYWFPRSRAGRPLVRTEQGAARGGASEQSVMGRRRAPTFPPVPPRGAPASGARRRPAVRAGGGRSPGGRSRHRGRGPGWGQRRHTRRLPPRGKGSEAKRRPCGKRIGGRLFPQLRSASLPPRRPPRVAPGSPRLSRSPSPLPPGTCSSRGQRPHLVGNAGTRGCTAPDRRCQQVLYGFCPSCGFPRRLAPRRALHAGGAPTAHPSSSSLPPRLSPSSRCPSPTSRPLSLLPEVAPARAPGIPVPHHPRGLPPSQPSISPGCPVQLTGGGEPAPRCRRRSPGFPLFVRRSPLGRRRPRARARGGGRGPGRPPANRRQRCVGRRPMGAGLPRVIGGRAAAWPECQRGVSPPAAESGRPPPPPLPCPSLPSPASVWERRGRPGASSCMRSHGGGGGSSLPGAAPAPRRAEVKRGRGRGVGGTERRGRSDLLGPF